MFEEFEQLHAKTSFLMNKYRFICEDNVKNKTLLDKKKEELDMMKKSSIVVNAAIKDTFSYLHTNITSIADKALACVFDEPYTIDFVMGSRGKSTKSSTVKIELKKNGVCLSKNLTESCEGGVLAILSVVLRISFILLKQDLRRIVLLDEILAPISKIRDEDGEGSNLTRAVQMIEKLSETFGVQCILVSHCLENKS